MRALLVTLFGLSVFYFVAAGQESFTRQQGARGPAPQYEDRADVDLAHP